MITIKNFRRFVIVSLIIGLSAAGLSVQSQTPQRTYVKQVLTRLEDHLDRFRNSIDDSGNVSSSNQSNDINDQVSDLTRTNDDLLDRLNNRTLNKSDVRAFVDRASRVDSFVANNQLSDRARTDWSVVSTDMRDLARSYSIPWTPRSAGYRPPSTSPGIGSNRVGSGVGVDSRLTGTFRLDQSASDNAQQAADRATNNMSSNERQRIHDSLLNRLESPDRLAIQKSGSQIILASSKSSQVTFQADGQERTEQLNDGRQVRVRTELSGDVLRINTNGDSGNNFTATIEPVDQGRRLRVRRSVNVENLNQTVTVQSYYDRTSDIAQLNIYDGANQNPISSTGNNPTEFLVPNGTQLVAILRNQLTSKNSQEGDRFTMEVRTPSEYNGAVIEGNVTNKSQAGRVTGKSQLGLNFERIRMPDGRTYKFAGLIDNIRTPEGQDIKVDNEGQAQSGSQTTKTATRGAVGAGLGALIGAIAGGGKGAAIGAVIGAGAGAGTAIIPGGEDLKLASGAEFTMRASAPQRN